MNEIIEVGIALLDVNDLTISDNKGFLIKPRYSEVSDFCTELTSITPEMVVNAPTFDYVCRRIISEYNTKARMWASYGEYDKKQFKKSCNKFQVEYPFNDKHLNIKTLASIYYGWDEVGMDKLLNKLKIPLEGTHHRGCDDANNIAKILSSILERGRDAPH